MMGKAWPTRHGSASLQEAGLNARKKKKEREASALSCRMQQAGIRELKRNTGTAIY